MNWDNLAYAINYQKNLYVCIGYIEIEKSNFTFIYVNVIMKLRIEICEYYKKGRKK